MELKAWLTAVDRSGLPGKFKVWIYQHCILPRLLWPLLIYEVPVTIVEGFEHNVSQFLRRWLGLPKGPLYGHANKLQLPFSRLTEEFKVTRAKEVLLYRDSSDNRVSSAVITVRTGRKWWAHKAIDQAEARLRHKRPSRLCGNQTSWFWQHCRTSLGQGQGERDTPADPG